MDNITQSLIGLAVIAATTTLAAKTIQRKNWWILLTMLPSVYLVGAIIVDLFTGFAEDPIYFHIGVGAVFLGNFISNLFILRSEKFRSELNVKHLLYVLKGLRDKYDFVVETVPIAIYSIDIDARIIFINDTFCSLVEYSREDLVGHSLMTIVPPENRNDIWQRISDRITGRVMQSTYITQIITGTGKIVNVQVTARRTSNGHIGITGCLIPIPMVK